jgi:hypothetical protein
MPTWQLRKMDAEALAALTLESFLSLDHISTQPL